MTIRVICRDTQKSAIFFHEPIIELWLYVCRECDLHYQNYIVRYDKQLMKSKPYIIIISLWLASTKIQQHKEHHKCDIYILLIVQHSDWHYLLEITKRKIKTMWLTYMIIYDNSISFYQFAAPYMYVRANSNIALKGYV